MEEKDIFQRFPSLQTIPHNRFPKHILIIPDGNGRWARIHKKLVTQGHIQGFQVAEKIIRDVSTISEIKIVTLWGFSSDNWKRGGREVVGLMRIFQKALKKILKDFKNTDRRFIHLGRKDRLPLSLVKLLEKVEQETENNDGQILCFALDFGGEDQMLRMLEQAQLYQGKLDSQTMYTFRDGKGSIPPADLLIRTSGEQRTSDIGWLNGAPTELYFTPKLFPDITTEDIVEAIFDFSTRERRFGAR